MAWLRESYQQVGMQERLTKPSTLSEGRGLIGGGQLDRQPQDCVGAQLGGGSSQPESDHPDPAGGPRVVLQDLDLEAALSRFGDSQDRPECGAVHVRRRHALVYALA